MISGVQRDIVSFSNLQVLRNKATFQPDAGSAAKDCDGPSEQTAFGRKSSSTEYHSNTVKK